MFKDKTTILAISYRRKGFSLRAMYMKFSILSFSFVTEGLQANHCCFMTISEPQHRKASIMRAKREGRLIRTKKYICGIAQRQLN